MSDLLKQIILSILSSILAGIMVLSLSIPAYAVESNVNTVVKTSDLGSQLDDMYKQVGEHLNINYMYVKMLHLIAGGKAVYADEIPNIYSEETVQNINGPFDIAGANQSYESEASWVYCPDTTIVRPSKYYLPDAAYNVTASIVKIMNDRYYIDRGSMQNYFNALKPAVKTDILFYESVLIYIGADEKSVDMFYQTYEKILYDKESNENVVTTDINGNCTIKDKFKQILISNGIKSDIALKDLAIIFSFDSNLAVSNNPDSVKTAYVTPYKLGYTSRENMMIAAMSLVGKCRYVWGGGHLTTGDIKGINPVWKMFNDLYPNTPTDTTGKKLAGYNDCIEPSSTWCPLHGAVGKSTNGCLFESNTVHSVTEYLSERANCMDVSTLKDPKFSQLFSEVNFDAGVVSHRLDGLDCSGYASWLYNQISSERVYDSGATAFIKAGQLRHVNFGDRLYAGDVFSWGAHIVIIVGPSSIDSNAYVILEQSPPEVKFGVLYFNNTSSEDINKAYQIARESNSLIGNINSNVHVNKFNADKLGFKTVCDTTVDTDGDVISSVENTRYAEFGRLSTGFIDEETILSDVNKSIKNMTALEIIQHTIYMMPEQYISGLIEYKGNMLSTTKTMNQSTDDTKSYTSQLKNDDVETLVNVNN